MHELGLCEAIVAAAVHRAAGRQVTGLRVRIGGHQVDPEVISQGVQLAAIGTVAQDAALDLVLEPLTVTCRGCGAAGPATGALALAACPACGGLDVDVAGRRGAELESITVEA